MKIKKISLSLLATMIISPLFAPPPVAPPPPPFGEQLPKIMSKPTTKTPQTLVQTQPVIPQDADTSTKNLDSFAQALKDLSVLTKQFTSTKTAAVNPASDITAPEIPAGLSEATTKLLRDIQKKVTDIGKTYKKITALQLIQEFPKFKVPDDVKGKQQMAVKIFINKLCAIFNAIQQENGGSTTTCPS